MSSATGIFLLVTLAAACSVAEGWWWNFDWSTEEPANCPHENHDTHKCSTLESMNATCISIKCCDEFGDDEDYYEYDDDASSESEEVYYIGKVSDSCSACYTVKPCSIYKCYTRCCDGYETDFYGRCRNKTGNIQCQNGGSPMPNFWGQYTCTCPSGFYGKSCEIPICHCENGGECVVKDGQPFCNCSYGHSGERCEHSLCDTECKNGGRCHRNGTHEFCECPHNYVGKYCEHYFDQPSTCPVPEYRHPYCATYCTGNSNCNGDEVCCKEGCTTKCRKPKAEYCVHNYRRYKIGESFKPDACTNCMCTSTGRAVCSSTDCEYTSRCSDGSRPETKPGQCCPSCPDKPSHKPPVIYGCPTGVLFVNTTTYDDLVSLSERNTFIRSSDYNNRRLEVKFKPSYVRHCQCKNPQTKATAVQAYARDNYGNVATCTFKVAVLDVYTPKFRNCPEDIYVFENEVVQWEEPSYYDNVGVADKTCTDSKNGKRFPVGEYTLTYQIWDYDRNTAFCRFHVSVTPEDTDIDLMPQGLRDRSKDKTHVMLIVGPIVGAAIIILVVVLLLLCCRRHRASRAGNARGQGRQIPAYDNNIYATPGDISVKLPPYSNLPMNPPPYTITGSEKDVTYMSIAPPSYTNPGYETLKVHLQRSESVKSTKSEKSDKEPEKSDKEPESAK
ncbi:neurogenic locus notch homolog protein 4-like [Mercenaria mercenaria]|uniref:neurogenic locus notch homolog protein 4-like n=1 Tax=Mercenaria mercenaria TaxID=6596 RepID=UPI00234EF406|nr:neurogenic locus notch homolog protein 4-like [Mercenaria mercenaria]XP_045164713.2 neurogenic locus notch homolog protein 4-like [Mercenaria mercenaria]